MLTSSLCVFAAYNIPFRLEAIFHEVESIPDSSFDHDVILLVIVFTEPSPELLLVIISQGFLNDLQGIISSSNQSLSLCV